MIFTKLSSLKKIKTKKIVKNLNKHSGKVLYLALAAAIVYNILFPAMVGQAQDAETPEAWAAEIEDNTFYSLPEIAERPPRETKTVSISAYSSTPDQTSGNPFITASGARVHEGTVANNCLPFGTKLKFPDLFGDREFVVEDRMNSRYGCETFDIWMPDRGSALQIGRRSTTIEIF